MLILILVILAIVLLCLAAFGVNPRGVSLGWLGLAIWCLVDHISIFGQ